MNILPFIITLLIILGVGTSTLFHARLATAIEKKTLEGYLNASRKLWNRKEQTLYNKQLRQSAGKKVKKVYPESILVSSKPLNHQKNAAKEEEEDSIKKKYFRSKKCTQESGKFNLYPVLHEPTSARAKYLYDPAAQLIRILYEHSPFWEKDKQLEYQILDALIQKKDHSWTDAIPHDSPLVLIFYKMLKGSNTYVVGTEDGIPPFLDFFRDKKSMKKKQISFVYAPKPVLQVFLEAPFLQEIEKKETGEQQKNTSLSKQQFQDLAQNFPQTPSKIQELVDLFLFSSSRDEENNPIGMDGSTGISVQR